jgi:hypothetical protein
MKKITNSLLKAVLFVIITASILFARPGDIDTDYLNGKLTLTEKLTYKALMLTDPESLPPQYRIEGPLKDGTLLVMDIFNNWDRADQEFKNQFPVLLSRVPKQAFFDTPSGFFRIHYDTTGGHAVYEPTVDIDPPDGVPDYVNRTGEYFDRAWFYHCDTLGYDTPPFDGDQGGGTDLYDVYMHHYAGAYGVTFMEFPSYQRPGRNYDYTSYIYVDPTYAGFGYNDRKLPMMVTSAHEFFHAVQFAYNTGAGGWYMENCATWMEDIMWDDVNDNYAYLYYFMYYPHYPITTANGAFEYGAFIWPMFLYENLGHEFIRNSWVYTINMPALQALDQVCIDYGTILEEQYAIFSLWNYLTNYRDDGNHYEEGSSYNLVRTMRSHNSYPVENMSSSSRPDALACNYISFVNSGQTGNLRIVFDGEDSQYWYLQIIKAFSNNNHVYDVVTLNPQNYGEYIVEDFQQYQWVAIVTDLIQGSNGDYLYSAYLLPTGVDENADGLPDNLTLLGNYPNPFNSRTVISLLSQYNASANVSVYDIGGRKILEKSTWLKTGANSIPLEFNPDNSRMISSGVFYYTVQIADKKITGKMLYLK